MSDAERETAEARTREARERLFATLGKVQERLRPSALAQDAVDSVAERVTGVARRSAEAVRSRPLAVAAVAGTIGLVMARRWIGDIVSNHRLKGHETSKPASRSKPKAASRPRAKKGKTT
ncbi:hypothetical protein [Sphingomonas sp.]|uniref:hypothetical protein n=1 Tax=Sphingomonas sp. TaxID=28214 RepID=UPI001B0CBD8E|nr:hypothetical protein [Sphingomonas sp.]MBO9715150.1 hypothetical protein [Sphingomonas sp.]